MEPATILGLGALGLNAIGSIWNAYQSKKTSNRNYDMQKATLDYQKYLNNNQIQIQTADALKAGINPLAMNGTGNLNSGNYSNVEAPQVDINGLSNIVNTILSNKTAEKNAATAAASAQKVAKINAESQERQTQMKIDADTEAQNNQQIWQTMENWEQRVFEANQNKLGRESAEKIANISAKAMKDVAEINEKLQRWINTYQPIIQGTGKDIAIDGNENGTINILSAQQYTVQKQLEEIITRNIIDGNYKAQLLTLQNELKDLQKKATDAGVTQGYINAIGNSIGNVGNLIDSIGSFGR